MTGESSASDAGSDWGDEALLRTLLAKSTPAEQQFLLSRAGTPTSAPSTPIVHFSAPVSPHGGVGGKALSAFAPKEQSASAIKPNAAWDAADDASLLLRTNADKELIEAVQAAFRSRTSPGAPPNAQLMEAPLVSSSVCKSVSS